MCVCVWLRCWLAGVHRDQYQQVKWGATYLTVLLTSSSSSSSSLSTFLPLPFFYHFISIVFIYLFIYIFSYSNYSYPSNSFLLLLFFICCYSLPLSSLRCIIALYTFNCLYLLFLLLLLLFYSLFLSLLHNHLFPFILPHTQSFISLTLHRPIINLFLFFFFLLLLLFFFLLWRDRNYAPSDN